MDQEIQERLRIYEQENLASAAIVQFVRDILLWLEEETRHACDEETAGFLASHLMLALARVERGEQIGEAWSPAVHAEASVLTVLLPWGEYIQEEANRRLNLVLPETELDFLILHLGTFLLRYNDPLVSQFAE